MRTQVRDRWLAVAMGNSRSLWGQFDGDRLQRWQRCLPGVHPDWADHPNREIVIAEVGAPKLRSPLLASRISASQQMSSQSIQFLTPEHVPLASQYETLGLDRSLALVGAASCWGWPVLVVDGGTALTVSAADETGSFVGGAILPGFGLQGSVLHDATAALPHVRFVDTHDMARQPERWATSTVGAIRSGIFYGILAVVREFYRDWCNRYPSSPIVFAGGDGELLHQALGIDNSHFDPALVLRGMAVCRQSTRLSGHSDPSN
ncbi:MAG: type III pantothenate kinase [Cyanobacteria bacterium P01_E01_bin.34]